MNSFVQSELHPLPLAVCVVETKACALIGRVEWSWPFVRVDFVKEKTKYAPAHPWELVRFDDVVSIRALSAEESRPCRCCGFIDCENKGSAAEEKRAQ